MLNNFVVKLHGADDFKMFAAGAEIGGVWQILHDEGSEPNLRNSCILIDL